MTTVDRDPRYSGTIADFEMPHCFRAASDEPWEERCERFSLAPDQH
jgi:hypothetical protein